MAPAGGSVVRKVSPMRPGPQDTPDPFLFLVYHKDAYPAGDDKQRAPRRGNGADFDPSAPYRMYHGDRVPGFPQHPHRGFETLTATLEGVIDHSDSMGNGGRYGHGDLQWMTAGRGVVHGEMFPLVNPDKPNPCRFFQIWLNLPRARKMCEPCFVMHWAEDIPTAVSADGNTRVRVWAGEVLGVAGLQPPPDSYASQPGSGVAVWHVAMAPGAAFTLPPAAGGSGVNRVAYYVEGSGLAVGGAKVPPSSAVELDAGAPAELVAGPTGAELLVLQGAPLKEPVAQHGPFVMNTREEIQQAFADYSRTRFGGWPWEDDAVVFARDKGRFALVGGEETRPPKA